jgi:hypothetical protein
MEQRLRRASFSCPLARFVPPSCHATDVTVLTGVSTGGIMRNILTIALDPGPSFTSEWV